MSEDCIASAMRPIYGARFVLRPEISQRLPRAGLGHLLGIVLELLALELIVGFANAIQVASNIGRWQSHLHRPPQDHFLDDAVRPDFRGSEVEDQI